jgi:hypothetical protein
LALDVHFRSNCLTVGITFRHCNGWSAQQCRMPFMMSPSHVPLMNSV